MRLAPGAPIRSGRDASATHGNVALEVPDGSAFQLEAESHRGQVEATLAGLARSATRSGAAASACGTARSGRPAGAAHTPTATSRSRRVEARAVSDAAVEKPRVTHGGGAAKPPAR